MSDKRHWWHLTPDEVERHNPPMQTVIPGQDGNIYESMIFHPDWQPVGYIPSPRTRFAWFVYHLIHGLVMRYPWWKVIGFALANTKPGDDTQEDE